ncbi:afuni [Apostichopus japonicus]|uniref:Afuni n=1 Tax=Stichopus japonicus TaxID=307972 RepID=A0A2G8L778_STIJA|nr:afuni [Apostichopus japonicus]
MFLVQVDDTVNIFVFSSAVRRSRSIVRTSYQANWVIEFNLSSITPTEKLTEAHLRLESLINLRAKTLVDYFQLSISSIPREEKITKTNVLFKDLVSNHTSDATKVGVDVLPLVQFWRNDLEAKHVINITVHCLSTVLKSQCERFMSKMHRPAQQFTNLVTVSMEGERCKGRSKRSSQNNKRDPPVKELSDACQRHSLYVGFREVGWDDWIIAPTGYQAYYCAGECIFPIGEQQNGTNHAVIQTLVSRLDYESVPDVCCAPVRLSPISLLFFDDDENVVLRRYDDMIVESCGCR